MYGILLDLCNSTAVCWGCPILGLFNFKQCPTCSCGQREKQKNTTSHKQQSEQEKEKSTHIIQISTNKTA